MPADIYGSPQQLKAGFGLTDEVDDVAIERVLDAVSRQIDDHCGFPLRHFYLTDNDTTRHYTATSGNGLWIEDCTAITAIGSDADGDGVFEDTWVTGDYLLWPYDAADQMRPYTRIETTRAGTRSFTLSTPRSVKITGRFGWPLIPAPVVEACLLQASRIFKRKDAPFGVAGAPEVGPIRLLSRLDPDVELMLKPLRRPLIAD